MNKYKIYNGEREVGMYDGINELAALDAAGRAYGFKDWDHLCISVPKPPNKEDMKVIKVN